MDDSLVNVGTMATMPGTQPRNAYQAREERAVGAGRTGVKGVGVHRCDGCGGAQV